MATGKRSPEYGSVEERERLIVREYESDVNTTQIQEKFDISPGQLYRILDKYGVKPRRGPGRPPAADRQNGKKEEAPIAPTPASADPLDDVVREDFMRTGKEYLTLAQIRAKHNVGAVRIQEIVKRLGLVRPDPPKSPVSEAVDQMLADRERQAMKKIPDEVMEKASVAMIESILESVGAPDDDDDDDDDDDLDLTAEEPGPKEVVPAVVLSPAGFVYTATVEYRTRSVVRITASSVVDAARQAAQIVSPTGGPAEVVSLSREE